MAELHVNIENMEFSLGDRQSHTKEQHYWSYLQLRALVHQHMKSGKLPMLSETAHPTGEVACITGHNGLIPDKAQEIDH